ncbi:alpha/beta-hydrolase [Ascobolus immersus RN42]|uniref:Alpha/beta-hydrolase n=1 Tax=Ascobolus immersus RN42 TaxID=1160509 RepID=A0A3N4I717_ASCIM|nr:alpha/beta-hydrolase [Ascobolus immersus RN42]
MLPSSIFLFSILGLSSAYPQRTGNQLPCEDVHIFIARGSTEPFPGRQGAQVDAICSGLPSCGYEDIIYPATYEDYCNSVAIGAANGQKAMADYVERCPDSKLVLTGYSQGAHVVGDIVGGGGGYGGAAVGCLQPVNPPLKRDAAPGRNLVAALILGDVRHTGNQSYNIGSGSSKDGAWPRSEELLTGLEPFADVLGSWCDAVDPVCAGGNDGEAHTTLYFTPEALGEMAEFVKSRL